MAGPGAEFTGRRIKSAISLLREHARQIEQHCLDRDIQPEGFNEQG